MAKKTSKSVPNNVVPLFSKKHGEGEKEPVDIFGHLQIDEEIFFFGTTESEEYICGMLCKDCDSIHTMDKGNMIITRITTEMYTPFEYIQAVLPLISNFFVEDD